MLFPYYVFFLVYFFFTAVWFLNNSHIGLGKLATKALNVTVQLSVAGEHQANHTVNCINIRWWMTALGAVG